MEPEGEAVGEEEPWGAPQLKEIISIYEVSVCVCECKQGSDQDQS